MRLLTVFVGGKAILFFLFSREGGQGSCGEKNGSWWYEETERKATQ